MNWDHYIERAIMGLFFLSASVLFLSLAVWLWR